MKRTTKIVAVMTVLFAPFALIVFPFFIGWMICDSFTKAAYAPRSPSRLEKARCTND